MKKIFLTFMLLVFAKLELVSVHTNYLFNSIVSFKSEISPDNSADA